MHSFVYRGHVGGRAENALQIGLFIHSLSVEKDKTPVWLAATERWPGGWDKDGKETSWFTNLYLLNFESCEFISCGKNNEIKINAYKVVHTYMYTYTKAHKYIHA